MDKWMQGSPLQMQSEAASDFIMMLEEWTQQHKEKLYIFPYGLPSSAETAQDLTGIHKLLLGFTEQFRRYGIESLQADQKIRIPRLPLTHEEVKNLIHERMKQDEQETLQQLMLNQSESAWIIRRLEINRPIVRAVLDELRANRAAQVNFARIISATRFKYATGDGLVPTKCPQNCGNADNYLHLLECYKLAQYEQAGIAGLDFMITMARRTVPPQAELIEPLNV